MLSWLSLSILLASSTYSGRPQSTPSKLPLAPPFGGLPGLRLLADMPLRDASVCSGPDGTWYLTGTVEPFYGFNEGIKVWKSKDMLHWSDLGMVWKYGDSAWHKPYLRAKMSLWAPEIHYLKGTFWLTYSMPGYDGTAKTSGSGLLRSTSGKPEGPYIDVHPRERMGDEIDASLFQDDGGKVYFLWHSGKIARMNDEMTGLAEPYHWIRTTGRDSNPAHHSGLCSGIFGKDEFTHIGYEGVYLFKGRVSTTCLVPRILRGDTVARSPCRSTFTDHTVRGRKRFLTLATMCSFRMKREIGGRHFLGAMTPAHGKKSLELCPSRLIFRAIFE